MKFKSIQYLRALAALAVVAYHAALYGHLIRGGADLEAVFGGRLAQAGVGMFFIISGFLMARLAAAYSASVFLTHRLIRIYPTYFLAVLLAWGAYTLGSLGPLGPDYIPQLGAMLQSPAPWFGWLRLVLAPLAFPDYPLGVEWTLLFEAGFYVLVYLVCLARQGRRLWIFALIWAVPLVWRLHAAGLGEYTRPNFTAFLVSPMNLAFIAGVLLERIMGLGAKLGPGRGAVLAAAALMAQFVVPDPWTFLALIAGLSLLFMAALEAEQATPADNPALLRLGDWSYALYLVHVAVAILVAKLAAPGLGPWALWAGTVGVALLAAAALGSADLFLYRRLKAVADRTPRPALVALAAVYAAGFLAVCLISGG